MQATDNAPEPGIATWKVELFVALVLLAFGALIAFKSWELGAGWRDDGPGASGAMVMKRHLSLED